MSIDVQRLETVALAPEIAAEMNVKAGVDVFHSVIVYLADGTPIQLEDRLVLPEFAPSYLAQDFRERSTTDYLQMIAPADQAEQIIEAGLPNAETKRLLKIRRGEACLIVFRKTWLGDLLTTYTRFVHPGTRRRLISRTSRPSHDGATETASFGLVESAFLHSR
ncbi:UTRA domain-containing protein [uncultured Enterovirga sp.]|uniref:UTRA domain-containing protein n=1 Tax=uncultured Enterovirga sp. TaxID=2026352 RepID=UPI0035CB6AFD